MLSKTEHRLTYHTRRFLSNHFTAQQIRLGSFCLALSTCLFDASVATFSLYTTGFTKVLGYTTLQNNIISASMLMGLYGTLPVLGYISDVHGPAVLALVGGLLTPGYIVAYMAYVKLYNFYYMVFAFFLIGVGTSSAYFCSLLTCAKIFPNSKGLGISLPVTFYGLSGLILAYSEKDYPVELVFAVLAMLYTAVTFVNWISSMVVTIEKEIVFRQHEQRRLLDSSDTSYNTIEEITTDDRSTVDTHTRFRNFLTDPSAHLLFVSLFLLAGPLEVYVANLATITTDPAESVSVFAVSSTLGRLLVGVIGDVLGGIDGLTTISSLLLVILAALGSAVGFSMQPAGLVAVGLVGVSYGSVFTAYPALVAHTWGVDLLGSAWGLFLAAPAIGGAVWGAVFAQRGGKLFTYLAIAAGVCVVGAGARRRV